MLEFARVTVALGGIRILREASFRIEPAETVALIGANGAGKTTTLRATMGLLETSGEIHFDGRLLSDVPAAKRPALGIGYAPEDRRLFSAFTVEENITMPGEVAGYSAAEVAENLERIYSILPELREMANRPAGSVSGGQGKMVALGRALMLGTRLVLLDEPFQGLAPVLAARYGEALRTLRETAPDLSIVVTESNPDLLKSFADRTITIERGEIVADAAPISA